MEDRTARYRCAEQVLHTRLADEVVMLDVSQGLYHHVNVSGTAVWDALQEPRSLDEIVRHVGSRFRGDPSAMAVQIEAFVDGLVAKNLVVPADAPR